ncbi:MAG: ATP-binding cassette domain-containing protein [Candidatus Kapaibacterium sp.]|jgi:heme exporter protein A
MISELYLHDLQVSYDGTRAVFAPVSTTVNGGEVVAVTGSNGAGKSSLLASIAGLLQPFRGSAILHANNKQFSDDELRSLCGYVAPGMSLYDELQAWEHVQLDADLRGNGSDLQYAEELLHRFGLDHRRESLIGDFSTGMKQRVKLVLALYSKPALLLLDEPTSNIDDDGFTVFADVVAEAASAGCIVIIATNDERERALCVREVRLASAV